MYWVKKWRYRPKHLPRNQKEPSLRQQYERLLLLLPKKRGYENKQVSSRNNNEADRPVDPRTVIPQPLAENHRQHRHRKRVQNHHQLLLLLLDLVLPVADVLPLPRATKAMERKGKLLLPNVLRQPKNRSKSNNVRKTKNKREVCVYFSFCTNKKEVMLQSAVHLIKNMVSICVCVDCE